MKNQFNTSLAGSSWWKPFLAYVGLIILIQVQVMVIEIAIPELTEAQSLLLSFGTMIVTMVIQAIFVIKLARIWIGSISLQNESFSFKGSAQDYLLIIITGLLLSIVTFGIYIPWFLKRIMDYMTSQTAYRGKTLEFKSTGGKMFKYFILALILPLVAWVVAFALVINSAQLVSFDPAFAQILILVFAVYLSLFVVIAPFMYLYYKWCINLQWNDLTITWKTDFWPSSGFIAAQLVLTVITLGIYWPAATIKCYRYFSAKTIVSKGGAETGRFEFSGTMKQGFGLLWGQVLLSIITIGIYLPWAYASILQYFVNNTALETDQLTLE